MSDKTLPALLLQDIHQRFGALHVLRGVTLALHRGETLGLIGPNGAGKTSLLNVISGFAQADAGQVMLAGRDISRLAPQARARLGLVRCFQSSHVFPEHSVRDNLVLALRASVGSARGVRAHGPLARSRAQAHALLGQTPLRGLGGVPARDLSYGQRRLLDLLIALAPKPALLLLDEPTAGLSTAEAAQAMQVVQDLCPHSTTLLVSHDLDIVFAHCDRIAVLNQGQLVTVGSADAIRSDEAAQKAYLGTL